MDVTSKPLIMDIDTGGKIEHLQSHITSLQNQGVSAVIMEDKKGLKKILYLEQVLSSIKKHQINFQIK